VVFVDKHGSLLVRIVVDEENRLTPGQLLHVERRRDVEVGAHHVQDGLASVFVRNADRYFAEKQSDNTLFFVPFCLMYFDAFPFWEMVISGLTAEVTYSMK